MKAFLLMLVRVFVLTLKGLVGFVRLVLTLFGLLKLVVLAMVLMVVASIVGVTKQSLDINRGENILFPSLNNGIKSVKDCMKDGELNAPNKDLRELLKLSPHDTSAFFLPSKEDSSPNAYHINGARDESNNAVSNTNAVIKANNVYRANKGINNNDGVNAPFNALEQTQAKAQALDQAYADDYHDLYSDASAYQANTALAPALYSAHAVNDQTAAHTANDESTSDSDEIFNSRFKKKEDGSLLNSLGRAFDEGVDKLKEINGNEDLGTKFKGRVSDYVKSRVEQSANESLAELKDALKTQDGSSFLNKTEVYLPSVTPDYLNKSFATFLGENLNVDSMPLNPRGFRSLNIEVTLTESKTANSAAIQAISQAEQSSVSASAPSSTGYLYVNHYKSPYASQNEAQAEARDECPYEAHATSQYKEIAPHAENAAITGNKANEVIEKTGADALATNALDNNTLDSAGNALMPHALNEASALSTASLRHQAIKASHVSNLDASPTMYDDTKPNAKRGVNLAPQELSVISKATKQYIDTATSVSPYLYEASAFTSSVDLNASSTLNKTTDSNAANGAQRQGASYEGRVAYEQSRAYEQRAASGQSAASSQSVAYKQSVGVASYQSVASNKSVASGQSVAYEKGSYPSTYQVANKDASHAKGRIIEGSNGKSAGASDGIGPFPNEEQELASAHSNDKEALGKALNKKPQNRAQALIIRGEAKAQSLAELIHNERANLNTVYSNELFMDEAVLERERRALAHREQRERAYEKRRLQSANAQR